MAQVVDIPVWTGMILIKSRIGNENEHKQQALILIAGRMVIKIKSANQRRLESEKPSLRAEASVKANDSGSDKVINDLRARIAATPSRQAANTKRIRERP